MWQADGILPGHLDQPVSRDVAPDPDQGVHHGVTDRCPAAVASAIAFVEDRRIKLRVFVHEGDIERRRVRREIRRVAIVVATPRGGQQILEEAPQVHRSAPRSQVPLLAVDTPRLLFGMPVGAHPLQTREGDDLSGTSQVRKHIERVRARRDPTSCIEQQATLVSMPLLFPGDQPAKISPRPRTRRLRRCPSRSCDFLSCKPVERSTISPQRSGVCQSCLQRTRGALRRVARARRASGARAHHRRPLTASLTPRLPRPS